MHFCGSLVGIDTTDEIVIERRKDIVALLQRVALFEFIGLTIPDADAGKCGVEFEFEDEDEVGEGREFLVDPADFGWVETTDPLVGHR